MAATKLISMHIIKGKTLAQCLEARTDYAKNPEKTEKGRLVTGYECDPMTVDKEFLLSKQRYEQITGRHYNHDVIAYQIRQSFKPGEVTPEEANRIGYETAMRFLKGKHAFIVATHTDRAHVHNHIIYDSTSLDCESKFKDFLGSGRAVARVSDLVCLEHGLSVIKPRPYSERTNNVVWPDQVSHRDALCQAIDEALRSKPHDFDELIDLLQQKGYEFKPGKQPAIRLKGDKRYIRFRSLPEGYSVEKLHSVIEGRAAHHDYIRKRTQRNRRDFSMLIDVEGKLQQGQSGYANWAKGFNVKQVSKAITFLQEQGIHNLTALRIHTDSVTERFHTLGDSIQEMDARLSEISEQKEHIINYARTSSIYAEYKKSGYNPKFLEAHRQEITLHRAARDYFNAHAMRPLPKVADLNSESSKLLQEKKTAYADYKKAQAEMKKYQLAQEIMMVYLNGRGDDQVNHRDEHVQR